MELTQALVKEFLDYDEQTGRLYWKARDIKWFNKARMPIRAKNVWNSKYAGTEAFTCQSPRGAFSGRVFRKGYLAHRIIWLWWYGEWPNIVDHEDGNPANNTINNLRNGDHSLNGKNIRLPNDNTSGIIGVTWNRSRSLWQAQIKSDGKYYNLGKFETIEEAAKCRREAEKRLNFHPSHGKR